MSTLSTRWAVSYSSFAAAFLAGDAIWIAGVGQRVYREKIPHLMAASPRPAAAAVFYLSYCAGAVYLAVRPQTGARTWTRRFRDGAIVGALAYGTWGFTGAAILKGFPIRISVLDTAWGAALTGGSAVIAGAVMDQVAARR